MYIIAWYLIIGCIITLFFLPTIIKESIERYKTKDQIYSLKLIICDFIKCVFQTAFAWPLIIIAIIIAVRNFK